MVFTVQPVLVTVSKLELSKRINRVSGLDGELELNLFEGCTAEVTFKQRQGRSVKSIQALTTFHNGQIESVSFPQQQQISENNLLKALLSSVQMDGDGSLNKGITTMLSSLVL